MYAAMRFEQVIILVAAAAPAAVNVMLCKLSVLDDGCFKPQFLLHAS